MLFPSLAGFIVGMARLQRTLLLDLHTESIESRGREKREGGREGEGVEGAVIFYHFYHHFSSFFHHPARIFDAMGVIGFA